ncbi:hypothetical protein [Hymenobacter siberiensis]|uniref:hypothetical protein n=1 Tax=Hymenobacter siberiensis TaxID=2848396 RepID=UPI001D032211|nr:hypothetical protein [Hymenobacter siberiensis]
MANTLGLNGEIRAAKAGNRQGRIISWMLLLAAALGLANPRPKLLAPVLSATSLPLVKGYWLAAQVAGEGPGRR